MGVQTGIELVKYQLVGGPYNNIQGDLETGSLADVFEHAGDYQYAGTADGCAFYSYVEPVVDQLTHEAEDLGLYGEPKTHSWVMDEEFQRLLTEETLFQIKGIIRKASGDTSTGLLRYFAYAEALASIKELLDV